MRTEFLCISVLRVASRPRVKLASCKRLGEERANLSAFRTFVRFVLFKFVGFLFLLGSGEGRGLRFVIVALPGLFSYLLCLSSVHFVAV